MNKEHRWQEDQNNKQPSLANIQLHLVVSLANQVGAVYTQQEEKYCYDADNTTRGSEKEDKNQSKNVADEATNLKINQAQQTWFKLILLDHCIDLLKFMGTH